jgi:hypothetical protein
MTTAVIFVFLPWRRFLIFFTVSPLIFWGVNEVKLLIYSCKIWEV